MSAAPFIGSRDPRDVYSRPGRRSTASASVSASAVDAPRVGRRSTVAPVATPRPRPRAQATPATGALSLMFKWSVVACLAGLAVYGGSALFGKGYGELERRSYATSTIRARAARADVTRLKLAYDRLTTAASFQSWAHEQGYVPRHLGAVTQAEEAPEDAVAGVLDEARQTD
ncbi:MAG: hypothetical protein KF857_00390 [Fimbriimonadaceae bacterium]|nr:hypothetical protein [Fimbriimonadaceae bacterium]